MINQLIEFVCTHYQACIIALIGLLLSVPVTAIVAFQMLVHKHRHEIDSEQ